MDKQTNIEIRKQSCLMIFNFLPIEATTCATIWKLEKFVRESRKYNMVTWYIKIMGKISEIIKVLVLLVNENVIKCPSAPQIKSSTN